MLTLKNHHKTNDSEEEWDFQASVDVTVPIVMAEEELSFDDRGDIAFVVRVASQFIQKPRKPHLEAVRRALRARRKPKVRGFRDAFILVGQPLKFCNEEVEKCIGLLALKGKKVDFEKRYISPQLVRKYFELVTGNSRITNDVGGANRKKQDEETLIYFTILRYAAYEYLLESLEKSAGQLAAINAIRTYLNGCVHLLETNLHLLVSKYEKGEWRSLDAIGNVLASLQVDEKKGAAFQSRLGCLGTLYTCSTMKGMNTRVHDHENNTADANDLVDVIIKICSHEAIQNKNVAIENLILVFKIVYLLSGVFGLVLKIEEMGAEDQNLKQDLMVAANALILPPSSVEELLPLLEELGNCLRSVTQSPSKSMLRALYPAIKALTAEELFYHVDVDVKVLVAFCINEIMRITAPDIPLGDEQMLKEFFRLIVAAFENLSDTSSWSYDKRVLILETFAKIRTFMLMMDLDCISLISQMFKHFLGNLRENHPDVVFSSMGLIMILTLENIDEIPPQLLSPLLDSVRIGNKDVLPITRKLGEKVIDNCASKLESYMHQAVKYKGFPLDSYGKIVARIYEKQSEALKRSLLIYQCNTPWKRLKISKKCDLASRRERKRIGGIREQGFQGSPLVPTKSLSSGRKRKGGIREQGFQGSPLVPTESLSSDYVKNGEASQPRNALLENQCKGTSVPKGKRSSNKVDSENDGNEMNSVLRDAVSNGTGVSDESGGKQLEPIRIKVVMGINMKDSSSVKQWVCKKRRGHKSP
ncbi:unnamed protein product [Dovyalis caffra]|uniref:ARM repeat superfamily protein n=1 Tax=Dovyalis caffra TaxID=77055 RepID=A0AAV1RRA8_9ROSI|nr:unnamed protein product [Dovyalis caffra]